MSMEREEAIKIVRLCCPKIDSSECDFETAMRVLVPELAESEDERIRKEIIEHFLPHKNEPLVKKWIAWLEKQKEQKPVEWSAYDKATIEYIIEDIKELRDEETDEEVIDTYDRELNLLQCINDSVKLCNYTNPAEWSEEDERIMQTMIKEGDLKPSEIAWLKSLRPQPHWRPTAMQMVALLRAVDDLQGKPYWGDINEVVYDIRDKLM